MIIESGVIVALGIMFTFFKLSWKARIWMLSHPLTMDIIIFIALNMIHWGTFAGVMTAATGALICSALLSIGRKAFGYIESNKYIPGIWNINSKLI